MPDPSGSGNWEAEPSSSMGYEFEQSSSAPTQAGQPTFDFPMPTPGGNAAAASDVSGVSESSEGYWQWEPAQGSSAGYWQAVGHPTFDPPDMPAPRQAPPASREPKQLPKAGETRSVRSGERPMATFRRLLGDFQSGVTALQGLSTLQRSTGNMSISEGLRAHFSRSSPESFRKSPGIWESVPKSDPGARFRPARAGQRAVGATPAMQSMREAPVPTRLKSDAHTSPPQMPSGARVPGVAARFPAGRADREAQQQLLAKEHPGAVGHMPAAARLAQVLRAEALMKSGEAKPSGTIFAAAQAIREGRRGEVADLKPEVLQNALSSSLGGPTRAKQLLSDPISQQLVTRHQTALNTLKRGIKFLDQPGTQRARVGLAGLRPTRVHAGHARTERDPRAPKFAAPSPALASAAMHSSFPGSSAESPQPPLRAETEPDLKETLTNNEFVHLSGTATQERERRQARPKSEFSPLGHDYTPAFQSGPAGPRSPVASFIEAPKPQARPTPQASQQDEARQYQKQQKLKGTFQLRGHNNQLLGVVELEDGEITDG